MRLRHIPALLGMMLIASPLLAQSIVHDEALVGDLSGSGTSPTNVVVSLGVNQITGSIGTTGGSASIGSGATNGVSDADFFTLGLLPGAEITSITTTRTGPGAASFIGHAAASDIVGVTSSNAGNLNSATLFGNGPLTGSAGGLAPFPSTLALNGPQTFLIQETGAGSFDYTISFTVEAAAVPEPTSAVVLGGLTLCGFLRRRRS